MGYNTAASRGVPKVLAGETKSEVGPHVGRLATARPLSEGLEHKESGPCVGALATSPVPSWGSPKLQRAGQHKKSRTCGCIRYITLAM